VKNVYWLALALLLHTQLLHAQLPSLTNGILDLRKVNLENAGAVPLNGQWEFYMSELLTPASLESRQADQKEFIEFPSSWNELNKSREPGFGYATYRATVLLSTREPLALEIPDMYTAYVLWINDSIVASNGKVGTTQESSQPQYLPRTVPLKQTSDTLQFVLQISNFHHANGGIRESIFIGPREHMLQKRAIAVNTNIVMFCILIVLAIFFIILFSFSKRQYSLLYFCALCITWGIRSMFSNDYLAIVFWPDFSWELAAKIEYTCLFLAMIWAILFVGSLFPKDSNSIFKYLFCFCNGVFVLIALFFNAATFTQFLPVYLSFCGVLLIYISYVLIRALISDRAGALSMVLCTFMGVFIFSYDLIAFQGFAKYNPIITASGYIAMYVLMATALLYDLGLLKRTSKAGNILTYEDLYGK
jgi:hypothetical protein